MDSSSDTSEMFATETMAELCARQGRTADAVAIYRRLLGTGGADERHEKWRARMEALQRGAAGARAASTTAAARRLEPRAAMSDDEPVVPAGGAARARGEVAVERAPEVRPSLFVEGQVRSGQVIYAEGRDLIVVGGVNPGAQLIADGHIHVYGPLRGRAVAGAHGFQAARIFCQRLEGELVGIDAAYLTFEDLPAERRGKPAQIVWRDGRCTVL